ncbi:hypothetical protein VP01_6619g1, partial [Puccinia sorghi]
FVILTSSPRDTPTPPTANYAIYLVLAPPWKRNARTGPSVAIQQTVVYRLLLNFCNCSTHSRQTVDLIDIMSQTWLEVNFCPCTPAAVRLLSMGYLASTPKRPETAFLMQLLGFHNHLWQWCHVSFMPFMGMLRCWLEERSPPLFTACGKKHSLRKQFTQSVDVYQKLMK